MEAVSYQCPACGAPLRFDGSDGKLHCDSCGNSFEIEGIEQLFEEESTAASESSYRWEAISENENIESTVYTCPQCGGEIIGDSVTAAARCPYCDNNIVFSSKVSGILKPDLVVPFKTTKEQAVEALRQYYKNKKLLPNMFRDENRIKEIRGIYIPFWLFSCDADANYTFNCTKVHSWTSGSYRYTKTDHFAAVRAGGVGFSDIPVDASSKMPDDLMDSLEPFDFNSAISFGASVLSGFSADKFDVSTSESLSRANDRVDESVYQLFRSTVNGYTSVQRRSGMVNVENGVVKYAMLPVWILNTRYRDKLYTFAMNGQTGKLIGNLPVDRGKYWKRFILTAAAIAAPVIAVLLMKGGGLF